MTGITYPLTPPSSPTFSRCEFMPRSVTSQAVSPFTLQAQVQEHDGQLLEVSLSLPPMTRAQAEYWISFLAKLHGQVGTFLLTPPGGGTPRGTPAGTPLVSGPSQTGDQLVVDGWTPSATGVLLAGDWIQVGTGTTARLHKVLDDADASGGGVTTLRIWPSLRESPANNSAVVTSNPQGAFRLASANFQWSLDLAKIYGLSFAAREAI